jgi:hypothetical protein
MIVPMSNCGWVDEVYVVKEQRIASHNFMIRVVNPFCCIFDMQRVQLLIP